MKSYNIFCSGRLLEDPYQTDRLRETDGSGWLDSNIVPHGQIHDYISNTNYTHWVIKGRPIRRKNLIGREMFQKWREQKEE